MLAEATSVPVVRSRRQECGGAGMRTEARRQVVRPDTQDKLPHIRGDVIAQSLAGQSGFLYYDGAKYAWYDPRTYKPDWQSGTVHGRTFEARR
jgi:hypothetical protein